MILVPLQHTSVINTVREIGGKILQICWWSFNEGVISKFISPHTPRGETKSATRLCRAFYWSRAERSLSLLNIITGPLFYIQSEFSICIVARSCTAPVLDVLCVQITVVGQM